MAPRPRKPARPDRDLWGSLYPTLDLHGYSADEATRLAERWLIARRGEGERVVRLITGRGLHSVGPPVLPTATEDLLRGLKPAIVSSFEREAGGGVYRVTLRLASPSAASPSTPKGHDLELVRRAEIALADLGIQPTPALIEAEIRRIVNEESGGR